MRNFSQEAKHDHPLAHGVLYYLRFSSIGEHRQLYGVYLLWGVGIRVLVRVMSFGYINLAVDPPRAVSTDS